MSDDWIPLPVCPRCNLTGRRGSDGISVLCGTCGVWLIPPKDDPPTKPSRLGSCVEEPSPLAESVAALKLTIRDRVHQTPWRDRLAFPISFGSIDRFVWEREQKAAEQKPKGYAPLTVPRERFYQPFDGYPGVVREPKPW